MRVLALIAFSILLLIPASNLPFAEAIKLPVTAQVTTTHNNGVIEEEPSDTGAGFNFDFPVGTDHRATLRVGVFNDGVATSAFSVNLWTNNISPNAFIINNPPIQQVSQAVYNDGDVEITQTVTTLGGNQYSVWNIEAENINGLPINDFRIGIFGDWDTDSSIGGDQAAYDIANDIAYQFDITFVGISSPRPSSTHDLRSCCDPLGAILAPNNLNALDVFDETANLNWNFGSLAPGQSVTLDVIVGAGTNLSDLQNTIQDAKNALKPSAIGGDIVPLDTTMVLVAGAQSSAAWMIPVLVSAIGIGIVIARKF